MPDRQMPAQAERRLHPRLVKPEYEDSGLFKRHPCIINAALVPQFSHSRRGDLIVRGFLECGTTIEAVFAGRRARTAIPVEARLRKMLTNARRRVADATTLNADMVRLYARIHGAWRPRFVRNRAGWETRNWQFMAAQWSILDGFGAVRQFGEPPFISQALMKSLGEGH
ncbi:hypothetical protein [Tateyamaria sp.]|uniref:hypothetical protein n=1 Tax=Tateyamaria sp. TaxID=1929288 RepID=UPI00329BDBDE